MIKNKPVIGIMPTYNKDNPDNDPYLDKAYYVRMYAEKIEASGGIPIGLINTNVELYTDLCDGYLWPGGHKINREFFKIIADAIKNNKPLLGVCLGAQAIATYFNILEDQKLTNIEDLNEAYEANKNTNPYMIKVPNAELHNHYITRDINTIENAKHKIFIEESSVLHNIYQKDSIDVVSLHSYQINRLPNNIKISAKSTDNVIEAIEYNNKILGVQFHPEVLEDQKIFDWLIKSCNKE